VTSAPPARAFDVRHVQLARAAFAAIAAVMITFSPDHSAAVGLAVFSGFAIATALVHFLSAWLVYRAGERWPAIVLGILALAAGMVSGIATIRTTPLFFALVITWALASGLVETIVGARARRAVRRAEVTSPNALGEARDTLTIGILTLVLGAALLVVPSQYALQYYIADADRSFTLTGITIGVGILGGYAAIVAVYLAIAGLSPRRPQPDAAPDASAPAADSTAGGAA
jgi:MFS family permease